MPDFVTDKSFDLEKTYEYILSIQVRLDGFSFSVLCPKENKLLAIKSYELKISSYSLIPRRLKDWVESEDIFRKPFKKIRIVVYSNQFNLIPEKYCMDDLKANISKLIFGENKIVELAENVLNKLGQRLIFDLPIGLTQTVQSHLGECEVIHPILIVANNLPDSEKLYRLVLIFCSGNFYLTLFKNDNILLTNSYKITHANDVVFYILTALKQLAIDTKNVEAFYNGINVHAEKAVELLYKYFEVNQLVRSNSVHIAPEIPDMKSANKSMFIY